VPARTPPAESALLLLSWSRIDDGTWALGLDAPCPSLQGLNVTAVLPPGTSVQVEPGTLSLAQSAPVFVRNIDRKGLDASLAVLGAGTGIAGAGELLRVTLPAGILPRGVVIRARDVSNAELNGTVEQPPEFTLPTRFALMPNVPNPFNPATRIAFDLPVEAVVRLTVYAVDGARVRTLHDGRLPAGSHEIIWDGRTDHGRVVASGTYFYRIETGDFRETRKMTLMK